MNYKFKRILNSPFVRNVTVVVSGTASAQALTFLLSPIITRLYGPEAYGMLGVFNAIVAVIISISTLTYSHAIVLPKKDKDAKRLIGLSLVVALFLSVAIFTLLFFLNDHVIKWLGLIEIQPFLWLIPIVIIMTGFLEVLEQWLIRTKQFNITAKSTFFQSFIMQGGKVGFGYVFPYASTLILFSAIGSGIKAFIIIFYLRFTKKFKLKSISSINIASLKEVATEYKDFPKYRAPQLFINAITNSLPVLLLSTFFGPASAGFYSIGRTVLNIPSQLIGKSVGDVFYPKITEEFNKGKNITMLLVKATLSLGGVGLVPFGVVIIFGPWIFSLVFGSDWYTAGEYARWLALWMFFMFMNQPSIKTLMVLSKQSFHLRFTIFSLIVRLLVLIISYHLFSSDEITVAMFGIVGGFLSLSLILITIIFSKKYDQGLREG